VQEYESEFWLHDVYIGNSQENYLTDSYFRQKFARTRGTGYSYGGHEKNRLFLNMGGTNFVEAAHLLGVAMEEDCRNVAMQDLDNDGRADLIVTTFETYPATRQRIRFFRNGLPSNGRSVDVKLADLKKTGATGRVVTAGTNAFAIVAGESYRTQLPPVARVGIGAVDLSAVTVLGETNLFRISEKSAH
jgi:hypothetical protein